MYESNRDERASTMRVLAFVLALVGFFVASQSGFAQSSNGQITGLITDSTGAAVEGAAVSAMNTATGVTYTGKTNSAGVYVLPQLIPGPYKVSLSKEGFATIERTEVTVRTGDRLSLDLSLKLATTKEIVTVTESAPLL